jgi:hypothetical protein
LLASVFTCNFNGPVWCVGDFGVGGAVYLPIIMKNFPRSRTVGRIVDPQEGIRSWMPS